MGLTQPREETRMSQQNTGGESNPAHFSVNGVSRRPSSKHFREGFSRSRIDKVPGKAALCPLSAQKG
jgi:hypothetical protein